MPPVQVTLVIQVDDDDCWEGETYEQTAIIKALCCVMPDEVLDAKVLQDV